MEHTSPALLSQAEAVASDGDGRRVVQQAVKDCGGQYLVSEDVAPLTEGFVAGEDDAPPLIAAADELKQKLGDHSVQRSSPSRLE